MYSKICILEDSFFALLQFLCKYISLVFTAKNIFLLWVEVCKKYCQQTKNKVRLIAFHETSQGSRANNNSFIGLQNVYRRGIIITNNIIYMQA